MTPVFPLRRLIVVFTGGWISASLVGWSGAAGCFPLVRAPVPGVIPRPACSARQRGQAPIQKGPQGRGAQVVYLQEENGHVAYPPGASSPAAGLSVNSWEQLGATEPPSECPPPSFQCKLSSYTFSTPRGRKRITASPPLPPLLLSCCYLGDFTSEGV